MSEVFFYHLQKSALEQVLPDLLEKTLQRGWRAVVQAGSAERVERLSSQLWAHSRDGFLPHGSKVDGSAPAQPVWLTDQAENPNGAQVLFLVDGAAAEALEGFERVCDIFDGNDADAVTDARERWKRAKAQGHSLAYWQQEGGRWAKKAEG